MASMLDVSRDAQVVAYCLFMTGAPTSVTFQRPHIIHPRTRAALDELLAAGFLEPVDGLGKTAIGWKANAAIGMPTRDFPRLGIPPVAESDSFPITSE